MNSAPPKPESITVFHEVMTQDGMKVLITWVAAKQVYAVTGENNAEAFRAMAQMEEQRAEAWRGF